MTLSVGIMAVSFLGSKAQDEAAMRLFRYVVAQVEHGLKSDPRMN